MFETETNCIDERREDAPEAPVRTPAESAGEFFAGFLSGFAAAALPMLAFLSCGDGTHPVFPPAPYFLLALGVGLLIGVGMLAISTRQPSDGHTFPERWGARKKRSRPRAAS